VPRRVTLVALWVVFAVASVGVGFAAANLVSAPFTEVGNTAQASAVAGTSAPPVTQPAATSTAQSSGNAGPSASGRPSSRGGSSTAGSTKGPGTGAAQPAVKRGISTRGGFVSATCQGGSVSVGAAPAVYWRVDSLTPGRVRSARVRLAPANNANGERVEVTATCVAGTPTFSSSYSDGGGDDGGGGDGSGDSGGSSGSGGSGGSGSDDSSGSGGG